jgi:hypothetical protein
MYVFKNKKGAALIFIFVLLVSLTLVVLAFVTMVNYEVRSTGAGFTNMKAFYIAEAGRAKARWALTTGEEELGWGEADVSFGSGTYTVTTTDNGDDTCTITSEGYIPDDTNPIAQRRVIERDVPVTTNLSLAATASASSAQGSNPASDAIDGSTSSKWAASDKDDAWLKLDYGSSITFNRVVVNGQKNIDSVTIEYSDDDSDYDGVTSLVESPTWTFTFDSVSARYMRLSMGVDANKRAEVDELESYDTTAGSIILGQGEFVSSW